ncbi:MAG: TerC family protein [Chlorobi bacterium]|nr:TerC family protein [Chlorobiota bacterium]MCI0715330.1 TerC family protein [Chlorobiota bacterium]
MEIAIALITLIALEIVLGIDNIIFISILAGKLPENQHKKARITGLSLAMIMRILLLFSISLIMMLTEPLFSVFGNEISGRDLILIAGGLFLIAKSTFEIHEKLEGDEGIQSQGKKKISFGSIIIQIMLLDIVFSLDSVITAIGMANQLWVMVTAVVAAVIFMMFTAGSVSDFVHKHPTIKILALSFLLLIGVMLVADGLDRHIPKGYVYFAMAFSVFVEMINLKIRNKKAEPVKLKEKNL